MRTKRLWIAVDVEVFGDERIIAAGTEGLVLYLAGLAYSRKRDTDGRVPASVAPFLAPALVSGRAARGAVEALERLGLWTREGDSFTVGAAKWAQWQQTAAGIEASRAAARERMARNRSSTEQQPKFDSTSANVTATTGQDRTGQDIRANKSSNGSGSRAGRQEEEEGAS